MFLSKFFKSFLNCAKYSDKFLWAQISIISLYSLLLVASVSREGHNYFIMQAISILVGLIGAWFLQMVNFKMFSKYWLYIGGVCILLIIYTLFFGVAIEGASGVNAKAWIKLPGHITFQPSELAKIGFVITFAKHIDIIKKKNGLNQFKNLLYLMGHTLVPVVLTHLQGDDGAAIIFLCIAMTMLFIAGVQIRYFILAIIGFVAMIPLAWKFVLAPYQKQRILIQMNPEADPLNMGYQQIQGKLSIGSGRLFGYGLFKGPRVANSVVPIQESDFIFSVAGEELGFFGCVILVLLLLALIIRISQIAKMSNSSIGSLACFGFVGLIASQTIFNLGMCLSLLPVMGVTLPFFSVGGSSAACLYLMVGFIQNIYITREQKNRQKLKI